MSYTYDKGITAAYYAGLSELDRRMWRLHNIPVMTQEEVIEFYERCIKPLELTPVDTNALARELASDAEHFREYRAELESQIASCEYQIRQLTEYHLLAAPESQREETFTSTRDEME